MPFLTPTLLLYSGLGLAGKYQKVIPQADALEIRVTKVSRSKTEYMYVNEMGDGETVLLQGVEVPKVKEFKYLGSTVQCNGG